MVSPIDLRKSMTASWRRWRLRVQHSRSVERVACRRLASALCRCRFAFWRRAVPTTQQEHALARPTRGYGIRDHGWLPRA
jgi:hypothetical protein